MGTAVEWSGVTSRAVRQGVPGNSDTRYSTVHTLQSTIYSSCCSQVITRYRRQLRGGRGEDEGSDGGGARPSGVRGLPQLLGHQLPQRRPDPRGRGSHRSLRPQALDIIASFRYCERENLQRKFTEKTL